MDINQTEQKGIIRFLSNSLLKKQGFLVLGGIILIISAHILPALSSAWDLKNKGTIGEFLDILFLWVGENGNLSGGTLLTTGILILLGQIAFEKFWSDNVKPFLTLVTDAIQNEIQEARSEVRNLLRTHKLEAAIASSASQEVRDNLRKIHTIAYGSHCESERGLYHAIATNIGKYLDPRVPHRSNHHQDITIEEHGDLIKWTEHTSYDLHTVALDDDYKTPHDNVEITHDLTYGTTAKYSDIERVNIEIKVNDDKVISLQDCLNILKDDNGYVIKVESTDDSVTVDANNEEYTISICKPIVILKGKTSVRMREESILSDDFYTARRDTPTCNSTLTITIPTNWTFDFFAVPPGNWHIIEDSPSYKRKAYTSDWVLPGIVATCAWRKNV